MSTTNPRSNQGDTPVTPSLARRNWRQRLAARLAPSLTAADTVIAEVISDLQDANAETRRWKQHADSFAQNAQDLETELNDALLERGQLLAWLAALHPTSAVITPAHDGKGTKILYLVAGGWQLSWHIHDHDVPFFAHVTEVDVTDPRAQWDGHGTAQKYERIRQHVRLLALEADAEQLHREAQDIASGTDGA